MKSFREYLTESQKTYKFKISIAGELPEGFEPQLKTNLQKFELVSLSSGKKTPITERPLDFPQLQNTEVYHYEAEVKYPTTVQVLQQYLVDNCAIDHSHIRVRGEFDPIDEQQAQKDDNTYESLLTTEELGGESAQTSVGGNRVMELIKELEVARKEREIDPIEGAPKGKSEFQSEKSNMSSPIGS